MTQLAPAAESFIGDQSLLIERMLPHDTEKIWRALTEGPLLEQWLLQNDFQPVVGHRFTFRAKPSAQWTGLVEGQVLEVHPTTRLSYRWNVGENPATRMDTVVTWTLTPVEGGVMLRVEQSGFRPEQQANLQGAQYGWNMFLGNLERLSAELE